MFKRRARTKALAAGTLLCVGLLSACAAPSSQSAHGSVTLTLVNANEGNPTLIDFYNDAAAAYTRLHPNVHIKVKSITFASMLSTGTLILSGPNPPALFEVAQTYGSLFKLAQENLILPLTSYAKQYGWSSEAAPTLLGLDGEVSVPGHTLWSGKLYGMSDDANLIGVFYNKKLLAKAGGTVPTSLAAFEHDMSLGKQAGSIPLTVGGGANTYELAQDIADVAGAIAPSKAAESYLFRLAGGAPGTTWTSPYVTSAAAKLQQWSREGYLSPNLLSLTESAADAEFTSGKSLFIINGNWQAPPFKQAMGSNVGFFLLPSGSSTHGPQPVAAGGNALTIPTHGPDHAEAAAFINFAVGIPGAKIAIKKTGQIPIVAVPGEVQDFSGVNADTAKAWLDTNITNGAMPFWGSNTPDALTQLSSLLDELLANRITPTGLGVALQQDEVSFAKTLKS